MRERAWGSMIRIVISLFNLYKYLEKKLLELMSKNKSTKYTTVTMG